jgi:hypothetical protein
MFNPNYPNDTYDNLTEELIDNLEVCLFYLSDEGSHINNERRERFIKYSLPKLIEEVKKLNGK